MGERFLRTMSPTKGEVKREVLRVKRVKVEGLFGLYNHDIPLNAEERVTIIHGPNGVGKTVLLKMIAAVFDGRYEDLIRVRFEKLEIEFINGTILSIESREEQRGNLFKTTCDVLDVQMGENRAIGFETFDTELDGDGSVHSYSRIIWRSESTKESANIPKWLTELRHRLKIHLIETQRLVRPAADERGALVPTVREYARDLQSSITEALAHYAIESQSIDQSFPQRLLQTKGKTGIDPVELSARSMSLSATRAQLEKIGLLDAATSTPFELESMDASDPIQSNVISLYIEDAQKKLSVLDDITRRITLLLDYVNGKFRNKSIQIRREDGFVVLGHDGAPIEPESLSSGEQHELVQLYDLLFRVKPGTLVLIDEPELSLHVLWQKKYLSELLEIAKTAEFDAIVATHSPFIAGDRSDLMVALDADIDA